MLSGCINYFDRNHSKLYCFDDLQKYLVTLDSTLYQTFHTGMLQRIGSDVTESDKSKVRSCLSISIYKYDTNPVTAQFVKANYRNQRLEV